MSNYQAHGLALTVGQRGDTVSNVGSGLRELAQRLEVDEATGTYHDYWAQHAEEHLLTYAQTLEDLATGLKYLAGRYTLTGQHRVEAEARGDRS